MAGIQDGTPSQHFKYDVFLSFRGAVRHSFADHLHRKLCDNGIETFRDVEKLKVGDEIRSSLLGSIEKSRMSIAVLCKDYASSPWCLDELAKIIACHEENGMPFLAIIYKVEPSDLSTLQKFYAEAMIKHEKSERYEEKRLESWRSALSKLGDQETVYCLVDTYEPEFIKKIVRDTSAKLPPVPLQIKRVVVGLYIRCEEVERQINIESYENVCMLEIYGPGGIGKTTFARCLFDKNKHLFEAACFLENVREKSTESSKGMEDLQKTLLSSMGEETETMLGSTFKGGYEIKRRLSRKKVLIVLDDVNSVKQLQSLAGHCDWFGAGSRIIITTRDTGVLDKHSMGGVIIVKYEMEVLNDPDSLELFSWYAFKKRDPPKEFTNVSKSAISFAKGFPLALRVIGSNLKGIDRPEDWEEELKKYRGVTDDEILGVLEISYNSLFDLDQKTFLDIACFFKGESWEYVKRILKACDFYPILRVFVSKSLITVNENGCLDMHDLIQDMGKEIVRKKSPSVGSRSRLWSHDDILEVLKQNLGSGSIEGIMLHPPQHEEVKQWNNKAFEKMENLRILIIRNTNFLTGPTYLPNKLRLLDWKGCPLESFPLDFYPHRIVDFKLPHSDHLSLERSFQKFKELTFINLSHCQSITQVPNLAEAENLRVLTLDRCHKLVTFDESVGFMPNLVYLSAAECSVLESFVPRMDLPSLEVLSFNFCKRLKQFPAVMRKMDKPLKIYLINTAIKEFPETISLLTGLEHIDISFCRRLKTLSSSFFLLPKLVTLTIEGCSQLGESFKRFKERYSTTNGYPNLRTLYFSDANLSNEALYSILQNFPKLEELIISHNEFTSIPQSIIGSSNIRSLDVSHCMSLTDIPELPPSIQVIDARYCQSLSSKASAVLWSKVSQGTRRLQVVMPKTRIPNWFHYAGNIDIPLFWARRKFPDVALAFVFGRANEIVEIESDTPEFLRNIGSPKSHIVGLNVFIDSQEISRKDYRYVSVGEDHVLLCGLQALFIDEEWQGLDKYLGNDWKSIQVQCESQLTLTQWGVYVYKQEENMDDIFKLPNPNSSEKFERSSKLIPKRTLQQSQQRIKHAKENFNPREIFGDFLPLLEGEENPGFSKELLRSWRNAKADSRGKASASAFGASIKQEHEESTWDVVRVLDVMKKNVPKNVVDSYSDHIKSAQPFVEGLLQARSRFMKGKGEDTLDIDMPIIMEEYDFDEGPSRRYWGRLEIKNGDPRFNAVMKRVNQLSWSSANHNQLHTQFKQRMHIVLLKRQLPSIEEASSSSHGEPLDEECNDPVLKELMSTIEHDAMNLNKSYGKLKASIVLTDEPFSEKYTIESLFLRGQENIGKKAMSHVGMLEGALMGMLGPETLGPETLGSILLQTPYGKLRVGHVDAQRISQSSIQNQQCELRLEHDAQHSAESSTQHQKQHELRVEHGAQKQIMLMTDHDAQRIKQKQRKSTVEHNKQVSAQNQKQNELRVAEHDPRRGALKPIKLMTEHDAKRAKLKQQKLVVEHNGQSSTQSQEQLQLKMEHDVSMAEHKGHTQDHELRVEHDAQTTIQNQQQQELGWGTKLKALITNQTIKILKCILCCERG